MRRPNDSQSAHEPAVLARRLYRLALLAYPGAFRRAYGDEMAQVMARAYLAAHRQGVLATLRFWLWLVADLLVSACAERIHAMRPSLAFAVVMTTLTSIGTVVASLQLYLLEDGNPLTNSAYQASPVLRVSYDVAYLSALVVGLGLCAVLASALVGGKPIATYLPIGLGVAAILVALGGFGGLLLRAPLGFALLFALFVGLALVCYLLGRLTTSRLLRNASPRVALILGACVSVGVVLLVNAAALVAHTLALNPASHPLFMQGLIPGTHFNALLIAPGIQVAALVLCVISLIVAARTAPSPAPPPVGEGS